MGFISSHNSQILYNNAMINFQTLEAAYRNGVRRYLYSSSACVYPEYKQTRLPYLFLLRRKTPIPRSRRTPTGGRS